MREAVSEIDTAQYPVYQTLIEGLDQGGLANSQWIGQLFGEVNPGYFMEALVTVREISRTPVDLHYHSLAVVQRCEATVLYPDILNRPDGVMLPLNPSLLSPLELAYGRKSPKTPDDVPPIPRSIWLNPETIKKCSAVLYLMYREDAKLRM